MRQISWMISLILVSGANACRTTSEAPDASAIKSFFENSTRRDPTMEELAAILRIDTGCTGFFVRNTANRRLIMSAQHCFTKAGGADKWCAEQRKFQVGERSGNVMTADGKVGVCERIVLRTDEFDIMLFEANFGEEFTPAGDLALAAYIPAVNTRLSMIGYPADSLRQTVATTTENCWVVKSDVASPHLNNGPSGTLRDPASQHNCTTYGGNSGGPMIERGTSTAIGLPFTYQPHDYRERAADDLAVAAFLARTDSFLIRYPEAVASLGLAVSHEQGPVPERTWERSTLTEKEIPILGLTLEQSEGSLALRIKTVKEEGIASKAGLEPGFFLTSVTNPSLDLYRQLTTIHGLESALAELRSTGQLLVQVSPRAGHTVEVKNVLIEKLASNSYEFVEFFYDNSIVNQGQPFIANEEIHLATLGVKVRNPARADSWASPSFMTVVAVDADSPLAAGGIESGDQLAIFGLNVRDVKTAIDNFRPGTRFLLYLVRRPDEPANAEPGACKNFSLFLSKTVEGIILRDKSVQAINCDQLSLGGGA